MIQHRLQSTANIVPKHAKAVHHPTQTPERRGLSYSITFPWPLLFLVLSLFSGTLSTITRRPGLSTFSLFSYKVSFLIENKLTVIHILIDDINRYSLALRTYASEAFISHRLGRNRRSPFPLISSPGRLFFCLLDSILIRIPY